MITPLFAEEAKHPAALDEHRLLDTPPTKEFDDLVRLAAHICGTPIAAVSLIDEHRQWFIAITGMDAAQPPHDAAFRAHTILKSDMVVVPDAQADPRFGDRTPRTLTTDQEEALRVLARQASSQIKSARQVAILERLIEEREKANEGRQRLASIVESSEDAIYAKTLDGEITSWNRGAETLYGYSAAEMIGRPVDILAPRDYLGEIMEILAAVRRGETTAPEDTVRITRAGGRIHVSLRVSPIRDADGWVVGASVIARDNTARVEAEAALVAQREFIDALLESPQEGIVACDEGGRLTLFNRASREFHGLPEQLLPPEQWAERFDLFQADGRTPLPTEDIPLFRAFQGETVCEVEMVIAPKIGSARTLGDYTVIRTPSNPTFYWGNFLLFDQPPTAGDLERWRRLFAEEIGPPSIVKHLAFGWDTTAGETGVIEPFLEAGFSADSSVVLTAMEVSKPPKFNEQIEVRRVTKDWEWEGALEVQVACREPEHAAEGYRTFKQRQMARWRTMTEAGLGEYFGAFVKDGIVGDLGVFVENGVGRFQSVGTHPDLRRRGICGTLVYEAARYAFEHLGAETLVMVADEDYHAEDIRVGGVQADGAPDWPDLVGEGTRWQLIG